MKQLKSILISFVLPIAAVCCVVFGCDSLNSGKMNLCKHQYALCTSAQCVPQPGDPTKAICFCDVEEGPSMGTVSCDGLQPGTDSNGVRTVYSTYSLKQYVEGKKGMKCPEGTPWTWCLNKRCTVDPADPKKAICTCDVVRTQEWMTLGGNCDTSTCATGYWSGAPVSTNADGNVFLMKALGIETSPVKWCPATTP
ncbi:MAG: hypothetical protein JSR39_06005 [Verrucomicrobia bacterium]|nr:hypothetical protein [Verrucomicrobiota bacterium]